MKSFIITLVVRNGEYEYYSKSLVKAKTHNQAGKIAEKCAKEFYSFSKKEDGWYFANGGEVATAVHGVDEIPNEHFDIIKNYIYISEYSPL